MDPVTLHGWYMVLRFAAEWPMLTLIGTIVAWCLTVMTAYYIGQSDKEKELSEKPRPRT